MEESRTCLKLDVGLKKWLSVLPQALASIVVTSLHLVIGQIIAYSGIIVPQMMQEQNVAGANAIPITESDSAWIASAPVFSGLAASILAGVLIDYIGRLKTIMLSGVTGIIGLVLIATASNMSMIIWGRIIIGITFMFIGNPTAVYISEISRPDVRGSFLTFMQVFMSIGMVLIYLKGWALHWRTIAWLTNAYLIIPIVIIFFIPESPAWLVSKQKINQAKKSLSWFHRYSSDSTKSVEQDLIVIQNEQVQKIVKEKFNWKELLQMFLLPTFYKPFLILALIFFFQQFSGAFVIIFNCIDPYLASIYISGMKVVMSFVATVLMKKFNRRTLLMTSATGMALSISFSGLNTYWIQQGNCTSKHNWIPLVCILLYIAFSSMGISSMPFMIAGELFPLKIRGIAYSLIITIVNLFTFTALQCYFPLYHLLGGSANLQYFYGIMSLAVMIVIYVFLPETHKQKLIDIENHFWKHTIYMAVKTDTQTDITDADEEDRLSMATKYPDFDDMDVLSASCHTLNIQENEKAIIEQRKQEDKFKEIIISRQSLSHYEGKKFKTLLPQILAAILAATFNIVYGVSLAYSAILIPQLLDAQNKTNATNGTDEFRVTESDCSWIASVLVIVAPFGSIAGGFMMDAIGRLNLIILATIPSVLGWILIATAYNMPMMIIGRILTGIASTWGASPVMVYVTEIARPDMRGSLISIAPAYCSLGMVLAYLKGWFIDWRTIAWICVGYSLIPAVVVFLIPESPPWLISKDRIKQAKKSLDWINKYQPQPLGKAETYSDMQLVSLQKEHILKLETRARLSNSSLVDKIKMFLEPTVYKPLLILFGLFIFQQFSGTYIMLFYAVSFFKEVGTDINPFLASIFLGAVRFGMSMINTWLMKRFPRRTLLTTSALGMAACMAISGLFTKWIQEGTTNFTWVPVLMLVIYVMTSMVGLLSIPWTIIAELFPIAIRGVAHSIVYSFANLIMFIAIQSYFNLDKLLGGSSGIQFFFAVVSLGGLIYSYIFLPETHKMKLSEIEKYFTKHTTYLSIRSERKMEKKNAQQRKPIVKNPKLSRIELTTIDEQSEKMIKENA
ncbi:hypothetical protein RN001_010554 [Aquatica leii]|uniref:Major facilitator superfamily (MFS) profile domain-containing protein n=1 Tax=Aquatica leii TaxID=1421715 RepID=A0AAN7P812_9COLE|nr:hypothetical protein RN001_010554 [Aquatica leii]